MIYMESRIDKFSNEVTPSRSARNARLYKEVYGKYDNLNNLPLEDNTDEIDMNKLQEILDKSDIDKYRRKQEETRQHNVIEQRKRNIDEQRLYDINKILEKAKYENNKLKDVDDNSKIDTSILSTLQKREISVDELNEIYKEEKRKEEESSKIDEDLSMTRELKFKGLSDETKNSNPLLEHVMPNNDLSLELFEDLKPTENTIITKPVVPKKEDTKTNKYILTEKIDVHSGDTSDIDIIKLPEKEEDNNDFFTNTYEFKDKDFLDGSTKSSNILKIILLFLAIIVFAGVIAYFVITYGIGA